MEITTILNSHFLHQEINSGAPLNKTPARLVAYLMSEHCGAEVIAEAVDAARDRALGRIASFSAESAERSAYLDGLEGAKAAEAGLGDGLGDPAPEGPSR